MCGKCATNHTALDGTMEHKGHCTSGEKCRMQVKQQYVGEMCHKSHCTRWDDGARGTLYVRGEV